MLTIDNVMWTVTSYSDILRIKADNDKQIAVYASNAAFTSARSVVPRASIANISLSNRIHLYSAFLYGTSEQYCASY